MAEDQVEVYEDPKSAEGAYARRTDLRADAEITLLLPGGERIAIDVAELLPGRERA